MPRFHSEAGIAIGMILFVIVLLGLIAGAIAASTGSMGTAGREDSITAQIGSQADLIRSKFTQCNMLGDDPLVWPAGTTTGDPVSGLTCPNYPSSGSQNLWDGPYKIQLPQVPSGFSAWTYFDYGASGGRCIKITPTSANTAVLKGMARLVNPPKAKFTSQEAKYTAGTGVLMLWITTPSGAAGTNCDIAP